MRIPVRIAVMIEAGTDDTTRRPALVVRAGGGEDSRGEHTTARRPALVVRAGGEDRGGDG